MLSKLFAALRGTANETEDTGTDTDSTALAVAALLVEAARADEHYDDRERDLIDHMLRERFDLSESDAATLRTNAEDAQAEATDMHRFSRVVKAEMSHDDKSQLIEDMWVIALSDAERAPYEEMIIRRLIGLIHLEDTESTSARRRAEARLVNKGV